MTAITKKPTNPAAHLTAEDLEQLGQECDAIRRDVMETLGARDAAYIRRMIQVQRSLELGSRVVLLASSFRPAWVVGTAGLVVAKILDNWEIGHNVLHGQWDWMRDPKIHSSTWEWEGASLAADWKRRHNESHHVFTNIVGKDTDLGLGIVRVDEDQSWTPFCLLQPLNSIFGLCSINSMLAMYDVDPEFAVRVRNPRLFKDMTPEQRQSLKRVLGKMARLALKEYVIHPLISGRSARSTLRANLTANLIRNMWTHSILVCGHFPEEVETFELAAIPEHETKGEWYVRQMLGSADFHGSKLLDILSGNTTHQIEHHMFPDMPSNRYAEVAPRVQALFEKYGLTYNTAPMPKQLASAWHKLLRLTFPNGWYEDTNRRNLIPQIKKLYRIAREHSHTQGEPAPLGHAAA